MWLKTLATAAALFSQLVGAQLRLPSPPYLPPDRNAGAVASTGGFPNPQWMTLLGNLLYFYDEQRSGTLPSTNRVPWRNASLIYEGRDQGIDLSGGFYDAGDYSKNIFPLSFSIMSMCWGATDFGKGYDMANQTAYLDDTLRWGLDWMLKAHPNPRTLYVLVSSATEQDTYWGGDLSIPSPRKLYQINDTAPGTDAAAQVAAAFAACSNMYAGRGFSSNSYGAPATLQNTTYAELLLSHAQDLYSFAVNATSGRKTYQTSVPQAAAAYGSSGYGDELTIAALFLARATGSNTYYSEAESYYNRYSLRDSNRVFNWDSKTPGLAVLFSQILNTTADFSGNLSTWQKEAETYFDDVISGKAGGYLTRGGLLFFDGDSDPASLNPALNTAMLLYRYAPIATSNDKTIKYMEFAKKQVEYALGNNPMKVPYVVGINPNAPTNPHSALASGGFDVGKIDTEPAVEAYVLHGAVVGGPDRYDRFFDIRSDWPQTEIALDYNAPMVTLASMNVIRDTRDPFYTSLKAGEYNRVKPAGMPCDEAIRDGCRSGLSKKARLAMGLTITIVGLIVLGLLGWYLFLVKKNHEKY